MSAVPAPSTTRATPDAVRTSPLVGWLLLLGGLVFLAGGPMHPKEDPAHVTVKQHLLVMFEDPNWYPAHAVLFAGLVLIAAALVMLARGGSLAGVPRAQAALVAAAIASVVAAPAMLLHLIAAVDVDRIAAGDSTPITNVQGIVETITVPAFGLSIAVLAVVGAMTHTLGNPVTAVAGVLGGLGYGIAGATILFTDRTDFLFPAATGIALWCLAAGAGLLLRQSSRGRAGAGQPVS